MVKKQRYFTLTTAVENKVFLVFSNFLSLPQIDLNWIESSSALSLSLYFVSQVKYLLDSFLLLVNISAIKLNMLLWTLLPLFTQQFLLVCYTPYTIQCTHKTRNRVRRNYHDCKLKETARVLKMILVINMNLAFHILFICPFKKNKVKGWC